MTNTLDDSRAEGADVDYWYAAVTSRPAPAGLQSMLREAYADWFPANPWRTRPGPELLHAEFHDDATADGELWPPVELDPH